MTTAVRDRAAPAAPDVEKSILGAVLLKGDAEPLEVAQAAGLTAGDFFSDANRLIFEAMVALADRSDPIDQVTLREELQRREAFELAGGSAYIASLVDGVPHSINVDRYSRIVSEKSALRQLARRGQELAEAAMHPAAEAEKVLEDHRGAIAAVTDDGADDVALGAPSWPEPLADEAFHGPAGEFVRTVEPHTESDPAALLTGFLVAAGNVVGARPYLEVEAAEHRARLFVTWVGRTAKGRKGTAWGHDRRAVERADETWVERVQSGLSSGEGLLHAVRDPVTKGDGDEFTIVDEGVQDKRLMAVEPEFARTLRVLSREGNTLSALLRGAWDDGRLQTLTKHSPAKATGAHVSLLGHITADELRRYLTDTEAANGFGNRFLWICVRRSKSLPFGGDLEPGALNNVISELRRTVDWAKGVGELAWAPETRPVWEGVYEALSEGRPGMLGAITARAEAYTVRLAIAYAVLDRSTVIRPEHLHAALAVWDYAFASARFIFGDDLGDPVADEILKALREAYPEGLTRTELRDHFHRHKSSEEIGQALERLLSLGLVTVEKVSTGGRPAEVWRAVR